MDEAPCPVCKKWDDKKAAADQVNWIICSNCEIQYHIFCMRINSLEFKELSQPWSLWFCPSCRNEGPLGDMSAKVGAIEEKMSLIGNTPAFGVDTLDSLVGPALDRALPKLLGHMETTVLALFDKRIDACTRKVDSDIQLLKADIDSRISERAGAAVQKHIDTLNNADVSSNRKLGIEIDRAVAMKVNSVCDGKFAALRTELLTEFKSIPLDPTAPNLNSNKFDDVSDKIDRQARGSHLVLRNIPSEGEAAKLDLRNVIKAIGDKVQFSFGDGDIKTAVRFKSTKHSLCPIIIKFKSCEVRDAFYDHYFQNLAKFTLSSLGLGTANSRVFLNEHLTERNMQIFNLASQHKRIPGSTFKKVATRNGLVFITLAGNAKSQPITSVSDLQRIIAEAKNTPKTIVANALPDTNTDPPQENSDHHEATVNEPAQAEKWSDSAI